MIEIWKFYNLIENFDREESRKRVTCIDVNLLIKVIIGWVFKKYNLAINIGNNKTRRIKQVNKSSYNNFNLVIK